MPRPRERLRQEGADALSRVELLALVLRTGSRGLSALALAERLLARFRTLDGLRRAGAAELMAEPGMGRAKFAALQAALELARRAGEDELSLGERLDAPEQVYRYLGDRLGPLRQERFIVLLLDSRRRLLGEVEVSRGSLTQSLVHPREVFAPALREAAASILVVHNHPSGDPEPSREDREVTRRLEQAGQILGVQLIDHVVIGRQGFASFAERGWMSPQVPHSVRR